jgi:hypothetical protein
MLFLLAPVMAKSAVAVAAVMALMLPRLAAQAAVVVADLTSVRPSPVSQEAEMAAALRLEMFYGQFIRRKDTA